MEPILIAGKVQFDIRKLLKLLNWNVYGYYSVVTIAGILQNLKPVYNAQVSGFVSFMRLYTLKYTTSRDIYMGHYQKMEESRKTKS